ncbi:MAG: hypothetical protein Q4F97_07555 [Bacteroidales bacterium]|nr:hypothetical protein [Bacteroidales bacterium]
MIKNIIQTIFDLGISPQETWKKLSAESISSNDSFFNKFLYPLIGITSSAIFLGIIVNNGFSKIDLAIKSTAVTLVTVFLGFFLASFSLKELLSRFIERDVNVIKIQRFVGYIYALWCTLIIVQAFFPMLFFVKFVVLYFAYIVFVGAEVYMKFINRDKIIFVVVSVLCLYLSPLLLEKIFLFLMPGMAK